MFRIRKGAVAPQHYPIRVDSAIADMDMNDVTAVTVHVRDSEGNVVDWSASIVAQDVSYVTAIYWFQAGDLDTAGVYDVWLELNLTYSSTTGPWLTDTTNQIEVFE